MYATVEDSRCVNVYQVHNKNYSSINTKITYNLKWLYITIEVDSLTYRIFIVRTNSSQIIATLRTSGRNMDTCA